MLDQIYLERQGYSAKTINDMDVAVYVKAATAPMIKTSRLARRSAAGGLFDLSADNSTSDALCDRLIRGMPDGTCSSFVRRRFR